MKKRRKQSRGGAPEWMVTYGDMMTLLLCFFILLAAFSELKKPDKYQDVIQAVKEAFGYRGGIGVMSAEKPPDNSIVRRLEATRLRGQKQPQRSRADDPGIVGEHASVKQVREGLQFTVGGRVSFDPGEARLKPLAKRALTEFVAERIRGQNNKIDIRGHAANNDLPPGSRFENLWDLSYARAMAVRRHLIDEAGIRPQRLRVVACSNHEPLRGRAYEEEQAAVNRRIEIIQTEALIEDFEDQARPNTVEPLNE